MLVLFDGWTSFFRDQRGAVAHRHGGAAARAARDRGAAALHRGAALVRGEGRADRSARARRPRDLGARAAAGCCAVRRSRPARDGDVLPAARARLGRRDEEQRARARRRHASRACASRRTSACSADAIADEALLPRTWSRRSARGEQPADRAAARCASRRPRLRASSPATSIAALQRRPRCRRRAATPRCTLGERCS